MHDDSNLVPLTTKQAIKALRTKIYPLIRGIEEMMMDADEIPLRDVVLQDMHGVWTALERLRLSLLEAGLEA